MRQGSRQRGQQPGAGVRDGGEQQCSILDHSTACSAFYVETQDTDKHLCIRNKFPEAMWAPGVLQPVFCFCCVSASVLCSDKLLSCSGSQLITWKPWVQWMEP